MGRTRSVAILGWVFGAVSVVVAAGNVDSPVVEAIPSPAGESTGQPRLAVDQRGTFVLTWQQKDQDGEAKLLFATREVDSWSKPRQISSGKNWFVNWADFPAAAALSDGSLVAHWLAKSGPGTYAYDIFVSRSSADRKTWSQPIRPHRDRTRTEHGFLSFIPWEDGRVGMVWLDGREMSGEAHDGKSGSMTLRYASLDQGGQLGDEAQLDDRVCECCQTSAARTSSGAVVVYRDRSREEIRDISVVVLSASGWTEPRTISRDGWKIEGCPVNGPSVSASGDRVAVAWFSMPEGEPKVQVAFSDDGGRHFQPAFRIDSGTPVGRIDTEMLDDGSLLVGLIERVQKRPEIRLRRVRANGTVDLDLKVSDSVGTRSAGFPTLARRGDEVLVAWTDVKSGSRVKMARVRLGTP